MSTTENDIIFDNIAEEAFPYLDELRKSGYTNMFDAPKFLMEDLQVNKDMAYRLVSAWMNQFNLELKEATDPEYGENLKIISLEEKK